jgi:hypothetical protein
MAKVKLGKEKWTLSFDRRLKAAVIREARKRRVYPVQVLESLVRDELNPFGHTDVENEARYVRKLRRGGATKTDEEFLEEIRRWEKITS